MLFRFDIFLTAELFVPRYRVHPKTQIGHSIWFHLCSYGQGQQSTCWRSNHTCNGSISVKLSQSFEDSCVADWLGSTSLKCQTEMAIRNIFESLRMRFFIKILYFMRFEEIFLQIDSSICWHFSKFVQRVAFIFYVNEYGISAGFIVSFILISFELWELFMHA